ncbi:hypothetical protein BaRGS_00016451 [Batillaria attramentaria]|uniref:MD-2-related lipid-recognition domain-containing protein n=1 Tax=Batillaria attramentaria TaxID=370345 RepID=A0ABD0KZW7_9CAEN
MLKAVIFLAVLYVAAADIVVYKDCGSKVGALKSVDVTPCPSEPCQFPRHKNITVNLNITANTEITAAKTVVYGYILGAKVPFPVPSDACQNMACPVSSGATVTYTNTVYVQPVYPLVSVVVQWELHDQNNDMIVCFNIPAEIVNS